MSSQRNSRFRAGATAVALAASALGAAAPAQAAPAGNHPIECRGHGVDPNALIRAEAEAVIDAPLRTIWALQTDVERWPTWQAGVLTMDRLDPGPLRKGSRFRWTTPAPPTPTTPETVLEVTSTVQDAKHQSCLRWTGPAVGEGLRIDEGVHVWTFTKVAGGVRVRTQETWTGAQVEADVPTATALLDGGLEQWMGELKALAEARA
ncbi:SRPBCC family protein [Umezawaea tangerina]|uniref:Uncharacterized protein YndB with AHSA1/START domain n=1 Tax=Umezawaea tangerina TaxID=84725 RepID=A0A2T0T2M5_9PSEU|nr:SRPBCC family protein [Umezawaea tangerina]PRY39907.1 uncharacterized protein YndB with AHSA1/START domain [Umezawaea tangerina]